MTQDGRPAILVIQELVHEQMNRSPKRIDCKVPNILRKREQRKRSTERQVCKRGLARVDHVSQTFPSRKVEYQHQMPLQGGTSQQPMHERTCVSRLNSGSAHAYLLHPTNLLRH